MLRIGDVAGRAGVSTRALRYYEEQGLLPAERTTSGQRVYPEAAVERVQLIQRLFAAGLPSRTIRQLLPSVDSGVAAPESLALLRSERDRITAAIAELERAREELTRVIDICLHPTPEHCPALREGGAAHAEVVAASRRWGHPGPEGDGRTLAMRPPVRGPVPGSAPLPCAASRAAVSWIRR
ncbi:MerR family transcriptional regulator [Clavibacter tessellarius]|uniref:MerR family transcriptional regulator n=1 Tax=Clavibacter tessellarius TaxID=31965 RepID=UPI000A6AD3ED|nr:MerR family transcriptional regulator [Clavibacter michiganensis]